MVGAKKSRILGISAVALMVTVMVVIPNNVKAGSTMEGYLLNEDWAIANGPADYACLNATLINKEGYAKTGYHDWRAVDDLTDADPGNDMPAYWSFSATTVWSWADKDHFIAIYEVYTGLNGYTGTVNYTSSTYMVMTTEATDTCPATNLTPIPSLRIESDDGNTLKLNWTAQKEAYDSDFDLVVDGYMTNMVNYSVFSDVGGSWAFLGYSDQDCGDYNTGWDGYMSFTYTDWGTLSPGDYHFRIAPNYKWTNYENNSDSIYTPVARGPILTVTKAAPAVNVELYDGVQIIAPPGNCSGWTASQLVSDIENNTDVKVLYVADFDNNRWISWLHRDGSDPNKTLDFGTDFALENGEAYYIVINASGATDTTWETGFTPFSAPLTGIPIDAGWNNVGVPYTDGGLDTKSDLFNSTSGGNDNFDMAASWINGGWDTSSEWDIQTNEPAGTQQVFDNTANAHGFFVRSTVATTWDQA